FPRLDRFAVEANEQGKARTSGSLDAHTDFFAARPLVARLDAEHVTAAAVDKHQRGARARPPRLADADDPAGAAPVAKGAEDGVRQVAVAHRLPEARLELGPAFDLDGVVQRPALGDADEAGDVRTHLGDPPRCRVDRLEVDTRRAVRERHGAVPSG